MAQPAGGCAAPVAGAFVTGALAVGMADNPRDVEWVEASLARLERLLYGEKDAGYEGLLAAFVGLREEVRGLREELRGMKGRRPNLWLWGAGYVGFLVSGLFAVLAVDGVVMSPEYFYWLDMPAPLALFLALVFAGVALLLFFGGFGWLGE